MPHDLKPTTTIRALVTDVDGVWTDGGMYFDAKGQALKRFDVKDGYIVRVVQKSGVLIFWVSGDDSEITRARGRRLGIDTVCGGVEDKGECVRGLLAKHGLTREQIVYMGDDLNDLPAMKEAGLAACPADAMPVVKAVADLITEHKGGDGAVREVCDLIMQWNAELERGSRQ